MHEMEAKLHALAARRWRVAIWLSVVMLIAYYGFILLVAFDKPLLSTILLNGTTGAGAVSPSWRLNRVLSPCMAACSSTSYGAGTSSPGLSLGILLGALVIVSAWVLTSIYVIWANNRYDHELHELAHLRG